MTNNLKLIVYPEVRSNSYYISENGDIFSTFKNDFMSLIEGKDGYLKINLIKKNKNQYKTILVSHLVAYSFIGPPPENLKDPTINHKDNNKKNNNFLNLEWLERSKNSSIRINKGDGELNHESKLTEEKVRKIREEYFPGLGYDNLAYKYNVSKGCIADIIKKRTWKYVGDNYDKITYL